MVQRQSIGGGERDEILGRKMSEIVVFILRVGLKSRSQTKQSQNCAKSDHGGMKSDIFCCSSSTSWWSSALWKNNQGSVGLPGFGGVECGSTAVSLVWFLIWHTSMLNSARLWKAHYCWLTLLSNQIKLKKKLCWSCSSWTWYLEKSEMDWTHQRYQSHYYPTWCILSDIYFWWTPPPMSAWLFKRVSVSVRYLLKFIIKFEMKRNAVFIKAN